MIDVAEKTFAEALGDNDDSLYRYLNKVALQVLPSDYLSYRDDFIQDFLIHQMNKNDLHGLNGDLTNADINENPIFRAFLGRRLRGYASNWVKNQIRRIQKSTRRLRPTESGLFPHPLESEEEENSKQRDSFVEYVSFQIYKRNSVTQLPEQVLVEREEGIEKEELVRYVHQALTELKPIHRRTLELFYFEGRSANEIAEKMDVEPSTVTSRLQWGRRYLREAMPYESRELFDSVYGKAA